MLKFGENLEKQMTEEEMAHAYLEWKEYRHDWCMKRAQEYLANKKVKRCWPFTIDFEGIEYVEHFALSPKDEAIVRNTIQECVNDSQMTKEQLAKENELADPLTYCGVDWEQYLERDEWTWTQKARIIDVDWDAKTAFYEFTIHTSYEDSDQLVVKKKNIVLTDEQYIQIVAMLLDDPKLDFSDLLFKDEELYKLIAKEQFISGAGVSVFMTELRKDAQCILETANSEQAIALCEGRPEFNEMCQLIALGYLRRQS